MADPISTLFHKADAYLRSAAVLLELEDYDSCASRCYFAMFYAAQGLLKHKTGKLPSQEGIRSAFVKNFVEPGVLPEKAGDMLDRGYDLQERADYSSDFAIDQATAERALQEAEAFVTTAGRRAGHFE